MEFEWNAHRFSGGMLVLDLINTIVHRDNDQRRVDRLTDKGRVTGFARAASVFRAGEIGAADLLAPQTRRQTDGLLYLREAADRVLRPKPEGNPEAVSVLPDLFSAAALASEPDLRARGTMTLGQAAAMSAMRALVLPDKTRIRACPNCDWLFLDRSKNKSRRWCDMNVCGNRVKAAAHYRKSIVVEVQNDR